MIVNNNSYRPHNSGHDYYEPGAYLITLVVTERNRCLSTLGNDARNPTARHLPTGDIVAEEWQKTTDIQRSKGRYIRTLDQVCMPDHWHGVILVEKRMDISLGTVIQYFKSACTARWRHEVTGYVASTSSSTLIRSIGIKKRRAYYATLPLIERPLFDDDYDDTICIDDAHLRRMLHYVQDNPRRAIIRHLFPHFMQRCMHVIINGTDYAAFGNLFLLRWAKKVQVFCHRKARLYHLTQEERQQFGYNYSASPDITTRIPYEQTAAYIREHDSWVSMVMQGATVLVTPGISKGEQQIKNECIANGYPIIHLQKDPISAYWKPEQSRFDACSRGSMLILAPWSLDAMSAVNGVASTTDYSRFHNLNALAAEICQFEGEARIVMSNI